MPIGVPTAQARYPPTVAVDPASAGPGEIVTLRGSGWPAGVTLAATMYEAAGVGGPGAGLTTANVDAAGGFAVQTAVPFTLFGEGSRGNVNVVPGAYTIVVSVGISRPASVPFTVVAPRQSALLWGEVYFDVNANGRRDTGDVPAFALVSARNAVHASPTLRAISDGRGRYVLPSISPGYYAVETEAEFRSGTWTAATHVWASQGQVARADLPLRPKVKVDHPERCFAETGFCVENDAFWDYFTHRGGVRTFGYPVSRTFRFQGFGTQFFQRLVLQEVPGRGVQRLNLLDPGLMPYDRINGATFPAHDPAVAAAAPRPDAPSYGQAVLHHLLATVPDEWEGQTVSFRRSYLAAAPANPGDFPALVALEVWGFPTSRPMRDPNNSSFVYQRFQRGILHYQGKDVRGNPIAGGILLADWFKSMLTGQNLPADLEAQARAHSSRYLRQYCPDQPRWVCRPEALPDTDLSFAFDRQR